LTLKYGNYLHVPNHKPLKVESFLQLVAEEGDRKIQSSRRIQKAIVGVKMGRIT